MEIWKSIPNYEGLYKISSLGNLLSLRNNKLLHPSKEHGYLKTSLRKDGKQRHFSIHQLVAMAFLGHEPCRHKVVVDHINENKLDNRVENLQIISNKENVIKSIKLKNNMKKLVLASALAIGLFSCQKEPSSCGVIVDDNVKDYSIVIRNSNTGNLKKFYLYPGDWINAHPGEDFCMLNEQEW